MGPENRNEAARFVTLIDALYEYKVKLLASAAATPDQPYVAGDGAFESERTASRLAEMQIGRALFWERVCQYVYIPVVAVSLTKTFKSSRKHDVFVHRRLYNTDL